MKKILLVLSIQVSFIGCTTTKNAIPNADLLQSYKPPFKIFGVGNWNRQYSVLTLIDAESQYVTIKTAKNPSNKIGNIYYIK